MTADPDARLVRWYKNDGDLVRIGDAIRELETDKTTVEIAAWANGVLRRRAKAGDVVRRDDEIARIEPVSS